MFLSASFHVLIVTIQVGKCDRNVKESYGSRQRQERSKAEESTVELVIDQREITLVKPRILF